ncbi:MAA2-related membrane protein [Metamycoplasma arthritidis]|uniref:Hypothetical lipoprotein n=1 Tax=Metamycoplasma arthritidis (strain 158L3-1) TaxID=243272 RepID=B3PN80_META1|nr:lipoprotein 17-related variable surface protein [Metamycoplasma arthritidis]ACF07482.1 hypothetical lipoprotein [Metamycoplasma arthritidis 158L3-1]VEU79003.1 MAA2-related membrane protein [Metamycoplasma arthritidis]
MKKSKLSLLLISLGTIFTPLISASCQHEQSLDEIFKKVKLDVDNKNKLTVDQVQEKDIKVSGLPSEQYKLKINSLSKGENSISVSLTLTNTKTNESKDFTYKIDGFKEKSKPDDKEKDKPDHKQDDNKDDPGKEKDNPKDQPDDNNNSELNKETIIKKILEALDLDKTKAISENKSKLAPTKKDKLDLTEVNILSYDDSKGSGEISVSGKYDGHQFSQEKITLEGFAKTQVENISLKKVELNKDKLVEDKKKVSDLESLEGNELLKYLKLQFQKSDGIELDITNSGSYEVADLKIKKQQRTNKYQVTGTLFANIKKFENGLEKIEKVQVATINSQLSGDVTLTNKDILNSLLKLVKSKGDTSKTYASEYAGNFKLTVPFLHNFLELEKQYEEYFGEGTRVKIVEEAVGANDIDGKLYVTYKLEYEENGGIKHDSITQNIELTGFKKITNDTLRDFLITKKNDNNEWNTIKQEIKKLYNDNKNTLNYEITRSNVSNNEVKKIFTTNSWEIIKNNDDQDATTKFDHKYWMISYGAESLEHNFKPNTYILENGKFQIRTLKVNLSKIIFSKSNNGDIWAKAIFDATFEINANDGAQSKNTKIVEMQLTHSLLKI